jgi:hypothetical protein
MSNLSSSNSNNKYYLELCRLILALQGIRSLAVTATMQAAVDKYAKLFHDIERFKRFDRFTKHHPIFFILVQAYCTCLTQGKSFKSVAEDGVLSTLTGGLVSSSATGSGRCMATMAKILGMKVVDRVVDKKSGISFPIVAYLEKSYVYINRLRKFLRDRALTRMTIEQGGHVSLDERKRLLIGGDWTEEKIYKYCMSLIARAFAQPLPGESQRRIASGNYQHMQKDFVRLFPAG